MKKFLLLLVCLVMCGTSIWAQNKTKDTRNFRLPGGDYFYGHTASDPRELQLFYIDDNSSVTMINPVLLPWINTKHSSIRILYPGDKLVWASSVNEEGVDTYGNATILRAGNNTTGKFTVLDTCSKDREISLVDLSPDGKNILYRVLYPEYCILKVSDWNGRITEFPQDSTFDRYNEVIWLNNEEILIQHDTTMLMWNLAQNKITTPLINLKLNNVFEFSTSGKALVNADGKTGIVDIATQRIEWLPDFGEGFYEWSPDGKSLYFRKRNDDNTGDFTIYDRLAKRLRHIQTYSRRFCNQGFLRKGTAYLFFEDDHPDSSTRGYPIWILNLITGKWVNFSEQSGYYWYGFMACPHLYYSEGQEWVLDSEVLGSCSGKARRGLDFKKVSRSRVVNGLLHIRIEENLYETTWLDSVALRLGEKRILPEGCPAELSATDGQYHVLQMNDSIELTFPVPAEDEGALVLEFGGYYEAGP